MRLCLSPLSLTNTIITLSFVIKRPFITLSFVIKRPFITLSFVIKHPFITLSFVIKRLFITLSFVIKHPFITLSFRSKIGREGFYEQYVFADAQSAEAYRNGYSLFSRKFWYIRESWWQEDRHHSSLCYLQFICGEVDGGYINDIIMSNDKNNNEGNASKRYDFGFSYASWRCSEG